MYRIDGCGSRVTRAAMILARLSVLAAPACAQQPYDRPPVMSLASAKSARDSVVMVLARNRADTGYVTLQGVGDEQRLMVGSCPRACRYGPRAKIQPHRATAYRTGAHPDSQVFIARIINLDESAYGKFNLHGRDTVYWAVGTRRGEPVSIFYSTAADARPFYSDLNIIEEHSTPVYRQAVARWIWDDRDEAAWGTCDGGRCCSSTGRELQ